MILLFFGFLRGQISLKYWGSIFPALQPHFMTPFSKMATSRLNRPMPHNNPSKLHTIIKLVCKPMFLNISNIMV